MTPTPEQAAFTEACKSTSRSILLRARAGAGKTTAIFANLAHIKGKKAVMMFNKKIADEAEARKRRLPPMTQLEVFVGTAHRFGNAALRKHGLKARLDTGKVNYFLKDMLENYDWDHPLSRSKSLIRQLVSFAKQSAFGVESQGNESFPSIDDTSAWEGLADHYMMEAEIADIWGEERFDEGLREIIRIAKLMLKQSNARLNMIDFDDMLYLPLLLNVEFDRYHAVFIDEAQDTNIVRQEIAFRMLLPQGRLIIVGDEHQAIYGFTGADARAMDRMALRSNAIELPLSVCWRCDEKIIDYARTWGVPDIVSHDKTGAGVVEHIEFDEQFLARLQPKDAILCRLNKPNVAVAIALLRVGKTPRIEGRNLGATLLKHARLAAPDMPKLDELLVMLSDYKQHQLHLLTSKGKDKQAAYLEDELEALEMLIERVLESGKSSYTDLEALTDALFVDDASKANAIVLSSIHKAKGLEWPRVYLLGPSDYMPFHRATADWELEQERNLGYVAATRAQHELYLVDGVQSAIDKGLHRSGARAMPPVASATPTPAKAETLTPAEIIARVQL